MNLTYPTNKQKIWLHLSSNHVKRVVFKLKIWRQLCPHPLKTLNPHFNQRIYQFPFLCSFDCWGKEIVLEKVLVLLARLVHLLEVSIKLSLLWIVDLINLLFWSCELEIMILKPFFFFLFLSCELELIILKNELAFFSFEVVTKELWFLKVGLYFLFGVVWDKSYHLLKEGSKKLNWQFDSKSLNIKFKLITVIVDYAYITLLVLIH